MTPESLASVAVPNVSPAGVASLDAARSERSESLAGELVQLRRRLDTERSAGKALLLTVLEFERRLGAERQSAAGLRTSVEDVQCSLDDEVREHRVKMVEVQRLWGEIRLLENDLRLAERPLWRKLLRRS